MSNNIYMAMAEVMRDVEAIGKDQKNQQQGFKFRGIDDVYNAVHPIFAKHGVFTVPTLLAERTEERQTRNGGNLIYRILTMKYTFYASDGSNVEAVVVGEGMDSGDKGANKGMAIAHKYALLQTLCIPTEDMVDPDSESQDPSNKKPDNQASISRGPERQPKPEPTSPAAPKQADKPVVPPYDPAKASMPKVASTTKAIIMNSNLIVPGMFTMRRAWNQILEICSGDKDFAKGLFEQFGAPTSEEITYDIYKAVFNAIKNPTGEPDGPELFEGDSLDKVPFEASGAIA
ncbi:ERF family protein [Sphaerochaeta globosa]|uniref:ERF family protein n=1 Tax=Sphaerochaeta globosa (strain ATCC BAA-1886 / DSM 22777 / Buddy) TaxID=158189 RepID=F0RWM9_SPHGB|nr:ERF family protein [Sphaerochaeta globosa]ADY13660.1 ERF family protein [Sphaerochaeta globosa str. Buddy]